MQIHIRVKTLTFADNTHRTPWSWRGSFVQFCSLVSANRLVRTISNLLSDNKKGNLISQSFAILDLLPCIARDIGGRLGGGWKQLQYILPRENQVASLFINCFCNHLESIIFLCVIKNAWQGIKCFPACKSISTGTSDLVLPRGAASQQRESCNAEPPGYVFLRD